MKIKTLQDYTLQEALMYSVLWRGIGNNIEKYKSYPRIVGETGGKDFIIAHKSAVATEVATAISRGAFEFQGQKCSAASRAYIPSNLMDRCKNSNYCRY